MNNTNLEKAIWIIETILTENDTSQLSRQTAINLLDMIYRLIHCSNKLNKCEHPEWERELLKVYYELSTKNT